MINHRTGFTLIELMVAVAILAILTTIAIPAYNQFTTVARRDDAKQALLNLANAQEQFYFTNNTYAANVAALNEDAISRQGHYNLVTVGGAAAYTITAAPVVNGQQENDRGGFQLTSAGGQGWDPTGIVNFRCTWDDSKTLHACPR